MNTLHAEQELHFSDYMNVMRKRRGVVLLFFITTVAVVTIGSLIMKPVYRATATLLIDVESPNVLTSSGMVSLESQNYYTYKEYYQSQKEIITSRGIVSKVFDELGLGNTREYAKSKEPIKDFLKTMKVEPVRDTRLLKLHVENKNPVLAAKIANRIAEIYVKRNLYYISRDESMNLLKNEYLKLEAKLSEYNKIYLDKHPQMIRLKKEIDGLVKEIEGVKSSNFNYGIREAGIQDQYALEGLKANNVNIEDAAEVPALPVKPKKKLNVLLAIIVGFFGGVGLAFFFEYLDDTVKDVEDIRKLTEWPFLGGIPEIKEDSGRITEFKKDMWVHINPKDPASEAYRAIRTSILFSATEECPLKTQLITSPGPQEGKTTTACNLAIAMAQNGKRVLLVDADMRKPRLHGIFKKKNDKGLSLFLSGQAKIEDIIQETDIENVSLVTGGLNPPNPSELIAGHRMDEFIQNTKKKFDFVIFDTPPVAIVTDAIVLSKVVDGLILVLESGKTSRRVLPRIFHLLQGSKAKVIGTVFNKISIKNSGYHYYYSRYYCKISRETNKEGEADGH
ncbi:MAG: polysaccharide biosynthesis tyrosine autokinase [Candidatus Omnitrophica bacterium]|nr:polysaccharide biosynthesis tyrosine autokinase [Candidatus Omnitrophota bacterium]